MSNRFRKIILVLIALTILLGIATIMVIRTIVPSFVVEGASAILVIYLISLVWLYARWTRWLLIVPIILSIFTIVSVFAQTPHIQLIREGYIPAIIIIFSGLILESLLLIFSAIALVRKV